MPRKRSDAPYVMLFFFFGAILLVSIGIGFNAIEEMGAKFGVAPPNQQKPPDHPNQKGIFPTPSPPDPGQADDLSRFFRAVHDEFQNPLGDVSGFFDMKRLAEEAVRGGAFADFKMHVGEETRSAFVRECGKKLNLGCIREFFSWKEFEIRGVALSKDKREAVVILRRKESARFGRTLRFWLTISPDDSYKVYDAEEIDLGMHLTHILAAAVYPTSRIPGQRRPELVGVHTKADNISAAFSAMKEGKLGEASAQLNRVKETELPNHFRRAYQLMEARYQFSVGNYDQSLERLDACDRIAVGVVPGSLLLRTRILNAKEEPAASLTISYGYIAMVGSDGEILTCRGYSEEHLKEEKEALEEYRKALDDDPDLIDAFQGLRRVLSADEKKELGDRLAKCSDPRAVFQGIIWEARIHNDIPALETLVDRFTQLCPQDSIGKTERIRLLITQAHLDQAKQFFQKEYAACEEKDRPGMLNAFLYAMAEKNEHLKAYAAVPRTSAREAFRILADELLDLDEDFEPSPAKKTDKLPVLTALIAAHRKADRGDVWLSYFSGVQQDRAGDKKAALKDYRAALDGVKFRSDPAKDAESGFTRFLYATVQTMYDLGRGLEAYDSLPAHDSTFGQLTWRFEQGKDAAGLEKLISAHRKRNPKMLQLQYWQGTVYWLQRDYEHVLKSYNDYLNDPHLAPRDGFTYQARDRVIRSLIRLKHLDDAAAAWEKCPEPRPILLGILLQASRVGNENATMKELTDLVEQHGGEYWKASIYRDEDLGPILLTAEYKRFRDKFPPPEPEKQPDK